MGHFSLRFEYHDAELVAVAWAENDLRLTCDVGYSHPGKPQAALVFLDVLNRKEVTAALARVQAATRDGARPTMLGVERTAGRSYLVCLSEGNLEIQSRSLMEY